MLTRELHGDGDDSITCIAVWCYPYIVQWAMIYLFLQWVLWRYLLISVVYSLNKCCPNISMLFVTFCWQDTEFPGVVARPIGDFKSSTEYQYQLLRCNVDLLKIIQVGMTFLDENGNSPSPVATWQFNFKFSLEYVLWSCLCCVKLHSQWNRVVKHIFFLL